MTWSHYQQKDCITCPPLRLEAPQAYCHSRGGISPAPRCPHCDMFVPRPMVWMTLLRSGMCKAAVVRQQWQLARTRSWKGRGGGVGGARDTTGDGDTLPLLWKDYDGVRLRLDGGSGEPAESQAELDEDCVGLDTGGSVPEDLWQFIRFL